MAYTTFQEFNKSGLDGMFLYSAEIVPIFIPFLLFTIYFIIAFGSYYSQLRLTGRGNFFSSLAVAGWMTAILTFVLSITPGLISEATMIIVFGVAIITTALLLFQSRD